MTACSWGRWLSTGRLKVDENCPAEILGTILFVGLLAGWSLLVSGWIGLLAEPPAQPRRLAFTGLAIAAFMLPMLSNDVFSLLAYGSVALSGHDVYTTATWLPHSVWYEWIGERWREAVCVYGPAGLIATLPGALAGTDPWLALLFLRLAWVVPVALVTELSLRRLSDRPFFHTMVWLNPLWIVEGPGQLHIDMLGMVAIVAGLVLVQQGRVWTGWTSYGLAVLCKYSFVLAGVWFWLFRARGARQRALRPLAIAMMLAGLAAVFFTPFWRGPATVFEPIRTLARMNPGGSITEVVATSMTAIRGVALPSATTAIRLAVEIDRQNNGTAWAVISLVLRIVTLGIGVRVLRTMLSKPHDDDEIALGTGVIVVAVITLASHRFQSWYLMVALPFFGLRCNDVWRRWWTVVIAVSVSIEFVGVLPRSAFIYAPWTGLTTLAVVVVFLMSFRGRYLNLPREPRAPDVVADAALSVATELEAP
jgi:hypothetical protein